MPTSSGNTPTGECTEKRLPVVAERKHIFRRDAKVRRQLHLRGHHGDVLSHHVGGVGLIDDVNQFFTVLAFMIVSAVVKDLDDDDQRRDA